jgi:hypothetical protein
MTTELKTPLTPVQLELLKAFAVASVDDTDVAAIRLLLSRYFADKASRLAQQLVDERGLTSDDVEALAHQHYRTPYPRL